MKKNFLIFLIFVLLSALCGLGLTACRGANGADGKDGKDGESGQNVTGAYIEDGELFLILSGGGCVGCGKVSGTDGIDGVDGLDGVGITDVKYNKEGELVIIFADGEERVVGISPKVCGHKYPDGWVVETQVGCVTQGHRYRICSECGFADNEIQSATGHDFDDRNAETVIEPESCTDGGWKLALCKNCGESKLIMIEPTDHTYRAVSHAAGVFWECRYCAMRKPSQGLAFEPIGGASDELQLTGLGTCTDEEIVVPDAIKTEYGYMPVTGIKDGAFADQTIKTLYLSKNIKYIEVISDSLFGNVYCKDMYDITIHPGNKVYRSDGNCIVEIATKTIIAGCAASSVPSDGSVTTIGPRAFCNIATISKIVIPEKVVTLGASAFARCTGLTEVTLGGSLNTIGSACFAECIGLEKVTVNGVPTIGDSAFRSCTNLKEVWINNGCERIKSYSFVCCTSLTTVHVAKSVKRIDSGAFGSCPALQEIYYGGSKSGWADIVDLNWNNAPLYESVFGKTPVGNGDIIV